MPAWIEHILTLLALPQFGLSTVFVVSFISATLIPLGSEPVVFGLVQLNPELFWPAILVATLVTLAIFLIPHSVFGSEYDYLRGTGHGTAGAVDPRRP